jgi:hypothetical protein
MKTKAPFMLLPIPIATQSYCPGADSRNARSPESAAAVSVRVTLAADCWKIKVEEFEESARARRADPATKVGKTRPACPKVGVSSRFQLLELYMSGVGGSLDSPRIDVIVANASSRSEEVCMVSTSKITRG